MDDRTKQPLAPQPAPATGQQESLAIRFPLPPENRRAWQRWQALLPAPWRRQVVIHGRRYWQPG